MINFLLNLMFKKHEVIKNVEHVPGNLFKIIRLRNCAQELQLTTVIFKIR